MYCKEPRAFGQALDKFSIVIIIKLHDTNTLSHKQLAQFLQNYWEKNVRNISHS